MAKKGKQGTPEPPKTVKTEPPGRTKGTGARGSRKTQLSELQKILIANGGRNHTMLRRKKMDMKSPKKRGGRAAA